MEMSLSCGALWLTCELVANTECLLDIVLQPTVCVHSNGTCVCAHISHVFRSIRKAVIDNNNRASILGNTHTHSQCYSFALALCPVSGKVLCAPSMGHWLVYHKCSTGSVKPTVYVLSSVTASAEAIRVTRLVDNLWNRDWCPSAALISGNKPAISQAGCSSQRC